MIRLEPGVESLARHLHYLCGVNVAATGQYRRYLKGELTERPKITVVVYGTPESIIVARRQLIADKAEKTLERDGSIRFPANGALFTFVAGRPAVEYLDLCAVGGHYDHAPFGRNEQVIVKLDGTRIATLYHHSGGTWDDLFKRVAESHPSAFGKITVHETDGGPLLAEWDRAKPEATSDAKTAEPAQPTPKTYKVYRNTDPSVLLSCVHPPGTPEFRRNIESQIKSSPGDLIRMTEDVWRVGGQVGYYVVTTHRSMPTVMLIDSPLTTGDVAKHIGDKLKLQDGETVAYADVGDHRWRSGTYHTARATYAANLGGLLSTEVQFEASQTDRNQVIAVARDAIKRRRGYVPTGPLKIKSLYTGPAAFGQHWEEVK